MTCKQLICVLIALLLCCSILSTDVSARDTGFFEHPEHPEMAFRDMEYHRYDDAPFKAALTELRTLSKAPGNDSDILELYEYLLAETEMIYTLTVLSNIRYYQNVLDETLQEEDTAMNLLQQELFDLFALEISNLLDSEEYGEMFSEYLGEDRTWQYLGYEAMTEEQKELSEQEHELTQRYYVLADAEYNDIAEENAIIGEVYLDLLDVRSRFAKSFDYDNYAELANEHFYFRDYDLDDMAALFANIKEYIIPAFHTMGAEYSEEYDAAVLTYRPPTGDTAVAQIGEHMGDISSELGSAWSYMERNGLYDREYSDTKAAIAFTISLPAWNSAFILQSPNNSYNDVLTLLHEFGHFAQDYYDSAPVMFSTPMFDLLEIHSQGLELLYTHYYNDLFGKDADAFRYELIYSMLNAIVNYAFLAELEIAVYSTPGITLEEINELSRSIAADYGADPNTDYSSYLWVYYSHMITSPMYSISYSVSALAALDIWMQSLMDLDFAVDTYLTLSSLHCSTPFQEALAWAGCSDLFDPEVMHALSNNLVDVLIYDEEPSGIVLERPREQSTDRNRHIRETSPEKSSTAAAIPNEMMIPIVLALIVLVGGAMIYLMRRR